MDKNIIKPSIFWNWHLSVLAVLFTIYILLNAGGIGIILPLLFLAFFYLVPYQATIRIENNKYIIFNRKTNKTIKEIGIEETKNIYVRKTSEGDFLHLVDFIIELKDKNEPNITNDNNISWNKFFSQRLIDVANFDGPLFGIVYAKEQDVDLFIDKLRKAIPYVPKPIYIFNETPYFRIISKTNYKYSLISKLIIILVMTLYCLTRIISLLF